MKILLIGQPNVGKTTLFNYLTKKHQKISNFAGTTVSVSSGTFKVGKNNIELLDTPGLYTLYNKDESITDKMVKDLILNNQWDLIINVVTEDNIHNNLLLTSNILDLGIPTIVIVNLTNNDKQNVDIIKLESLLGCKALKLNLNKLSGLHKQRKISYIIKNSLKKFKIINLFKRTKHNNGIHQYNNINSLLKEIRVNKNYIPATKIFYGSQIETKLQNSKTPKEKFEILFKNRQDYNLPQRVSKFVTKVTELTVKANKLDKKTFTDILDAIFLNKILGLPIFLLIMYIFFFVVINVSKIFQDFFVAIGGIFFVTIPTVIFSYYQIDNFFTSMVISLGNACQVILTFIPILFIFHICLDFLENSGYMSRGAYLTDSIMRFFGLPGKSLITMLVGFGCNVPAIFSTRTVSNKAERVLTIVAAPFISCSARLTVYVLFTAIFFPSYGVNIIYSLYLIGIIVGIFTVWFFKQTLFKNKESFFILELPRYRMPQIGRLFSGAFFKVTTFIFKRAGKIIIPVFMIFYILHYAVSHSDTLKNNIIIKGLYNAQVILEPMGITKDNWEATISLIGGTVAKELVVTTLQSLYLIEDSKNKDTEDTGYNKYMLFQDIKDAVLSLKDEAINLLEKLSFNINTESELYSSNLATIMESKFKGIYGAIAYLLFTVIYTPCLVTLGAVCKELNSRWMHFTNIWSILMAYICASSVFQILTFSKHKMFSTLWILGCIMFFILAYKILSRIKVKL